MRRQEKTREDKQGQRSVRVLVYETDPAGGRSLHHEFQAVSAHKMKMSSLLDEDRFEEDSVSAVVFIREDGAAVGSFLDGISGVNGILDSFNRCMEEGRAFCMNQERPDAAQPLTAATSYRPGYHKT